MSTPLVTNTADAGQVHRAKRKARDRERQQRVDMRLALGHLPTRRILRRLMYEARTGLGHALERHAYLTASVFDPQGARMAYNAGRQDLGHLLQSWIREADPRGLIALLEDALEDEQREERTNDAAHTAPASTDT